MRLICSSGFCSQRAQTSIIIFIVRYPYHKGRCAAAHPISFTFTSIALFVFNFRSQLKIKMMKYLWSACLHVSLPPLMFLNSLQNRLMCSNTGNSVILYRSPTDNMVLNFVSAWCLHFNYFHLLVRSVLFFVLFLKSSLIDLWSAMVFHFWIDAHHHHFV